MIGVDHWGGGGERGRKRDKDIEEDGRGRRKVERKYTLGIIFPVFCAVS